MAFWPKPIKHWPGALCSALVLFFTFGTLLIVALRAEGFSGIGTTEWAALRFTIWQALLSACLSIGLAVPLARALARRRFRGRGALIALLGAPFILPVIVAVFGLLAVFGRTGILSSFLSIFEFAPIQIYGIHGILLAHVFFNLPLATRLILHGWFAIPTERARLASALGLRGFWFFKHVEWPMLQRTLPGIFLIVFLICTTSFAVALTLGGGPKATTIELAIYQAFRFDFDLGKAAILGLFQFAIGVIAAALVFRLSKNIPDAAGLDRETIVINSGRFAVWIDYVLITLAAVFLLVPISMIVLSGLPNLFTLPVEVFEALGRSFIIAVASAAMCIAATLSIAIWAVHTKTLGSFAIESIGYVPVIASPLIIGTGLFILLFPVTDPVAFALPITAVVNALMALPFALRAIFPALRQTEAEFGRLADSLALSGWKRLRIFVLPRLKRPIGFATGVAAALSMGDLGVVALFADPDNATLPLQLFRLMSRYRMDDAAGAALLLLIGAFVMFWIFDRGGRINART